MATFEQNLAKIRGEAIYGPDMRTAIAEAIEQADDTIDQTVTTYKGQVDSAVTQTNNRVNAAIKSATDRMDAMQVIIDDHMWYISVSRIGSSEDYLVSITEGEAS